MAKPILHANWSKPMEHITDGFSLEITAKDVTALRDAAALIPAKHPVAITFLPGEGVEQRIAAARLVRELGFEPMPHFSARRIESSEEFERYLSSVISEADVTRCFVVAGDPSEPIGPFADSMSLITSGVFERNGVTAIGIGGHPEGHPNMTDEQCWQVLKTKCDEIERRGMAALIVTQFSFDAQAVLAWLKELRQRGIHVPVRLGVPGPAGIKTLLRFASRCGVGASASVLAKYGISLTRLIGQAGPDKLVDALSNGLSKEHGAVRLHFYPFGGLSGTMDWIQQYNARSAADAIKSRNNQ